MTKSDEIRSRDQPGQRVGQGRARSDVARRRVHHVSPPGGDRDNCRSGPASARADARRCAVGRRPSRRDAGGRARRSARDRPASASASVRMPRSRSFGTSAEKMRAVVIASPSAEWRPATVDAEPVARAVRANSRRGAARRPGREAGCRAMRGRMPGEAGPLAFPLEHGEIEAERVADHHRATRETR